MENITQNTGENAPCTKWNAEFIKKLLKQNDKQLIYPIREVGCFFRSALAIAEMTCGKLFSASEINEMWFVCQDKGFIVNREMVKGGAPVMNLAFDLLFEKYGAEHYKAIEIATSRKGVVEFYPSIPKEMRRTDAFICKRKTPKTLKYPYHFVVNDAKGDLLFDPYTPDVQGTTEAYTVHFFIKKIE